MTATQIDLRVTGILVGIAMLLVVVLVLVKRVLIRKRNEALAELRSATSGETVWQESQPGSYRGALEHYPRVKSDGVLCWTRRDSCCSSSTPS